MPNKRMGGHDMKVEFKKIEKPKLLSVAILHSALLVSYNSNQAWKSFEDNYDELKNWIEKNKRIPVMTSNDELERKLGIWCSNQRRNKRKNKLNEEKIKNFENNGLCFYQIYYNKACVLFIFHKE